LYELLTGTTPLEQKRLRETPLLELLRVIREEEPPAPSTRLGTTVGLPAIAAKRGLEPRKLSGLVKGELDWIVMKCLEKDRSRRYETANGLARDIERYLHDEPVQACPPSAAYRLRKFARRHKRALGVAGLILCFLVILGAGAGWAARDRAARRSVLEEKAAAALADMEDALREDKLPRARAALQRAEELLASGAGNEDLRQRAKRLQSDLTMATRLEQIRLDQAAVKVGDKVGQFDTASAGASYQVAFQDYGLDVLALDPEDAAESIRASAIKGALVAALDDWVSSRGLGNSPDTEKLLAIARAADRQVWRDRLSEAFRKGDRDALKALAQNKELLAQPPATLLLLARVLRESGEMSLAVEVLRHAQRQHLGDFWTNQNLAFYLMQLRPPLASQAVGFYRAAVVLRPDSPGVHVNLGNALRFLKQLIDAEVAFRKATELKPDYPGAHFNLGMVLKEQGRFPEAETAYRKAVNLKPGHVDYLYGLGVVLSVQGKVAEAIETFRAVIQLEPDHSSARNDLGVLLQNHGKPAEAIAQYREAVHHKPDFLLARANLANLLHREGKLAEAEIEYREIVRRMPTDFISLLELERILGKQGKANQVEAIYRETVRRLPLNASTYRNLGLFLVRQKRLGEAETAFGEALRLNPEDTLSRFDLAGLLAERGKFAEAEQQFRESIRRLPRSSMPHLQLARFFSGRGRVADAETEYREAVRLDPKATLFHDELGQFLLRQGKLAEAVVAYGEAVRSVPNADALRQSLVGLLLRQGKPAEAEVVYQEAVRRKPKDAGPHYLFGNAFARAGQWEKAAAVFARVTELAPDNHWNWYQGAALRLQTGDREGYRHACCQLLQRFSQSKDHGILNRVATTCLLIPDAGADFQAVLKLAERADHGNPKEDRYYDYVVLLRGLADYRAGRHARAAERLKGFSKEEGVWSYQATALAVLAMAQYRLGQRAAAREALTRAQTILAKNKPEASKPIPVKEGWHDWLHGQLLSREAEALLKQR
jgi:tetratricopeptide (TPR) repeat protein